MRLTVLFLACTLLPVGIARADKVIMKDGKVYEGRIMGETTRAVLITNAPLDPTPRFLPLGDVLTIVRERHVEVPSPDRDKYATVDAGLQADLLTTSDVGIHTAPGLYARGGFRLHAFVQVEAELVWQPALSGGFAVTDNTTVRGYEKFSAYHGGFGLRGYPFGRKRGNTEPYAVIGYAWTRLAPKGTDDYLKGYRIQGGVGVQHRLRGPLFVDARLLYEHTRYESIRFLTGEGTFGSALRHDGITLSTGFSWRI
jgi:hypothetical protein